MPLTQASAKLNKLQNGNKSLSHLLYNNYKYKYAIANNRKIYNLYP